MSDIISFEPVRAWDRDGITTPGALAYFYLSGTTTPQLVYTTEALDVAHPVPLEADANGVFPPVFSAVALRCTVTDSAGVTLPGYPIDPVAKIATGSGASEITFEPTGDIPETNVQAAIERVQANLVAPLLAGGIGVTGNADVLVNIDATNIASGAYRFDNTTTGTFPSGVTAAGGGTVRLWRETAAEAQMMLMPRGSSTQWIRTLTGSTWGPYVRVPATLATLGVTASAADLNKIAGLNTNAPGSAPAYVCRAWVRFSSAGTILASGNVSSVTRNAAGDYYVNFATAMPDANFSCVVTPDGDSFILSPVTSEQLTSRVRIRIKGGANQNVDTNVSVSVFR